MLPVALAALPLLLAACLDAPPDPPSGVPVFYDGFTTGFTPASFDPKEGAVTSALGIDRTVGYTGSSSIRFDIPSESSGFAGGVVMADKPQDLSGANALVFWAKATRDVSFDYLGFGLDFAPYPTVYQTTVAGLPLTTAWTRHRIPIPNPARLTAERGVFWYQDIESLGYIAWFDDVKFDTVDPASMAVQPALADATVNVLAGSGFQLGGLTLSYLDFDLTERFVDSRAAAGSGPAPAYFSFSSSDPSVASVDGSGRVEAMLAGQAIITASLGKLPVPGAVTVNVTIPPPMSPSTAPPAPTRPAADVIALLSKPYTPVTVGTWGTSWSNIDKGPNLSSVTIGGDQMKKYTALQYVGIEFAGANAIDATAMTHFHIDVWSPDATGVKIKLVDFGTDLAFGGTGTAADSSTELSYTGSTSPAVITRQWISFDIPLSSFSGLTSRAHLAQLIISSTTSTVFIDNVYFHK
jgi:hypothetical protein